MADDLKIIDLESFYNDSNYFVSAIASDYGFCDKFLSSMKAAGATLKVSRRHLKKTIEKSWLEAIESALPSIEIILRNPSKEIVESERVVPIEQSRNISSRSIRHLSQHTDYIRTTEEDGPMPTKILNVFRDETFVTYENKFLNTLIHRLYAFVNKRYTQIKADGFNTTDISMEFSSDFTAFGAKGGIQMKMTISDDAASHGGESAEWFERVEKLNAVTMQYMDSPFIKSLGNNFVRPPIMHTNAITKNKNFRECLILWEFIESYEKVGYTIDVSESAEKPDEEYIDSLYSMLALQYLMFKYCLQFDYQDKMHTFSEKKTEKPIAPKFVTKVDEIDSDEYDVYASSVERIVRISQVSSRRRLTPEEVAIREAVEEAISADKQLFKTQAKQAERNA